MGRYFVGGDCINTNRTCRSPTGTWDATVTAAPRTLLGHFDDNSP